MRGFGDRENWSVETYKEQAKKAIVKFRLWLSAAILLALTAILLGVLASPGIEIIPRLCGIAACMLITPAWCCGESASSAHYQADIYQDECDMRYADSTAEDKIELTPENREFLKSIFGDSWVPWDELSSEEQEKYYDSMFNDEE